MKFKSIFLFVSIFSLAIFGTAFVSPEKITSPETKVAEPEVGNLSFAKFLSNFEKTSLPFQIDVADFHKYKNLKALPRQTRKKKGKKGMSYNISKYMPELNGKAFSRMGPPKIMPVARFYLDDKNIAVVYKTERSFFSKHNFGFNMMVYDLKGNIVKSEYRRDGSFNLAYNNLEETETFSIDENGAIWKNIYKNIWDKDVEKEGYENNEIKEYELMSSTAFQIKKDGSVVEAKEYLTDTRASLD